MFGKENDATFIVDYESKLVRVKRRRSPENNPKFRKILEICAKTPESRTNSCIRCLYRATKYQKFALDIAKFPKFWGIMNQNRGAFDARRNGGRDRRTDAFFFGPLLQNTIPKTRGSASAYGLASLRIKGRLST